MAEEFEDIRSFRDHEANDKSRQLLEYDEVKKLVTNLLPNLSDNNLTSLMNNVNSIRDFQQELMLPIFKNTILNTFTDLTASGLENLDKNKAYLFISNHRDIVLDSAVMNYFLLLNDFSTAEIAIGDNLVKDPWIKDLVRLNKSFLVKRGLDKMEMLRASKVMSDYIKDTIVNRNESVWIAQRAGRAKDGNDQTNNGLITMFGMSSNGDIIEHYKSLNIVPVSVSYEFDPNDARKAWELYKEKHEGNYEKSEKEDVESMKLGIVLPKGKGHWHFGTPLDKELDAMPMDGKKSELMSAISEAIDHQIHSNYKLWSTNYLAHKWLGGKANGEVSTEEEENFSKRIDSSLKDFNGDQQELKSLVMGMYQQPLINHMRRKEGSFIP